MLKNINFLSNVVRNLGLFRFLISYLYQTDKIYDILIFNS